MGFYLTGYKYTLPSLFSLEQVSDIHATSYTYGQIEPNRNSPFFPLRSDEKIMRSDVKEAIVLVNELIEDLGGNIEQNTPLFIHKMRIWEHHPTGSLQSFQLQRIPSILENNQ